MKAKVVIGANYGDEGKGLVTNFLTRKAQENGDKVLVCLYSGGPQRGHTVLQNGVRHVFHHFGSGTLSGADTYIDSSFMINPIVFMDEYRELEDKIGYTLYDIKVYVDKYCNVTTPFEMLVNQIVCKYMGLNDSCGLGIWETYKNISNFNKIRPLSWYMENDDKTIRIFLRTRLASLQDDVKKAVYEKKALSRDNKEKERNISCEKFVDNYCKNINFDNLINNWVNDLHSMLNRVNIVNYDNYDRVFKKYNTVIVENGQGLLLDKDYDKVYGTPGSTNALGSASFILQKSPINKLESIELAYVSRPYITRHGEGPMIGEEIEAPEKDMTNQPNPWQGSLRYSRLDIDELYNRIRKDSINITNLNLINVSLYMTHGYLLHHKDAEIIFNKAKSNDTDIKTTILMTEEYSG